MPIEGRQALERDISGPERANNTRTDDNKPCIFISQIEMEGVHSVSRNLLSREVISFVDRCVSKEEIADILKIITKYYLSRSTMLILAL
ncbi:MAG: POTRA domain-containing protein [Alphaproteobacteria bacterium]|nr:POTRA domain-containing protein [Alphaproteobacteria bacterium]